MELIEKRLISNNMTFQIDRKKYIDSGLVNENEHPEFPLVLYNYTQECQFGKKWDDVTRMCRGLIVHKETNEIIARPFSKFFNYEEHVANGDAMPNEIPYVYEKVDGSLGILYWFNGLPFIATRGSFSSDQAIWATQKIREKDLSFVDKRYTYLFEIVYPENRIVVSYGDMKDLVFLGAIDIESGKTVSVSVPQFKSVKSYEYTSFQDLKALNTPNEEGFVLHFKSADFRVKLKFEEYVRLHKIMTGLSKIGIWEMLRDGKDPFAQDIPDEMFSWIKGVVDDLKGS
jgi:RNA ligase